MSTGKIDSGGKEKMRNSRNNSSRSVIISLLFLFTVFVAGCSPIREVSRDRLVENLGPILEVEERANRAMRGIEKLALLGEITDTDMKKLKEHYDVYYVHHKAASVFLAEGNIRSYESHVGLAKKELDSMEEKIRTLVTLSSF
jgi:hypothetical protein